jgi:hypothetical protein
MPFGARIIALERAICTAVRIVGRGEALWRVRVELFAPDAEFHRVGACSVALDRLLPEDDGEQLPGIRGDHGVDQGIGDSTTPVVGFLFWVHADDLGDAAQTAVDFARLVGRYPGVGPRLYKVTALPGDAVARPNDPLYPEPET